MADERVGFPGVRSAGSVLWFDGTYAALVCLALILLCVMAMRRHIRLRVALPTVILLAALAIGLETALNWNVVNIELVGTRAAPAVVITQREKAVVLFRAAASPSGRWKISWKSGA